jgi:hypothetical protein
MINTYKEALEEFFTQEQCIDYSLEKVQKAIKLL